MRAAFLALSFLHNSREDGGNKGSSHFDRTPQYNFIRLINKSKTSFLIYRIDPYIGPASVDWTSLTASKETGLEDVMLGVEVWLENMNESQYK